MRSYLLIFIFLTTAFALRAGESWFTAGSRQAAMGYTSATSTDFWSVNNNQAGLAFYDKTAVGVYYENRFMLKEFGYQNFGASLKTDFGMLGLSMNYTGDELYSNFRGGLSYARKFGNSIAAGVQLDYINTKLEEEYGSKSNVTFQAGIMIKLTPELIFGAHTFNPIGVKINKYDDERIPSYMNAGLSYIFSEKLVISAEAFKQSDMKMEFRSGAEYKLADFMYVRAGVTTQPFRYTFGVGFEVKNLNIDISSNVHETLGYSPQLSVQYHFGK